MKVIHRENYIKRIQPYINSQLIKVLVGQRRVGKTFILRQVRDFVQNEHPNANCIFIDKELHEFEHIKTHSDLVAYVEQNQQASDNYLFIDEVQEISEFEKALRNFQNKGNFDIYCTGSNAAMLSGEIATILSGRQIIIRVHPLSYQEFLEFHELENGKESLLRYLNFGGLPHLVNLPKEESIVSEYLKNIYATILFRDIVARNNIRDVRFLEDLVKFLADNTGSLFSAKKISDYLKSQQIKKSVPLISSYIRFLEDAFFLNVVKRSEVQGKKIFESGEKIYFEDLGIRNALTGFRPDHIHKNMENAVLNHLQIQGYTVYVGKNKTKEIDFIAERNNERAYFQVTYMLNEPSTVEREFGNLLAIKDNYPKYVISMDYFETPNTYKGVRHLVLENFLVEFE